MKIKYFHIIWVFVLVFSSAATSPGQASAGWKAGVARVLITPEEPLWMAGYASRIHPSEGTLQDIWAKALALEDAKGQKVVLVTTDLIGSRGNYMADRIRKRLKNQFGLSAEQVALTSSHTHSGPELMKAPENYLGLKDTSGQYSPAEIEKIRRYSMKLEDNLVALVGKAIESMVPAKLFSGNGVARFAVNRRNNTETTLTPLSPLTGPVDHSVPVINVTTLSGEAMAVVFGYACHNTTLSIYQFSGDYAGFAQSELEASFPGISALFFAGCGADQNPLPRSTIGLAKQYGKTLAAAVEAVISEPMRELSPFLSAAWSKVDLTFRDPPPTREELLKIVNGKSGYPAYRMPTARVFLAQLEQGMKIAESYPYPVQFWRIGEQNIAILSGEVVVDYSIRLKQIFGDQLFVAAYSNEMMGYIPSARVLSEGGYEATGSPVFTTPWAPDIEIKIIGEIIKVARKAGVDLP